MSQAPVIYLAYANDPLNPLPKLGEEDRAVTGILYDRSFSQHHYHLHRESHADLKEIRKYLTKFHNRVWLFHYGGHAGSEALFFESGDAQAKGLAKMLGEQANIRLVFLNGCGTQPQVKALLQAGVPIVIATYEKVNDTLATGFATAFYEALEQGLSIRAAFEAAEGYALAENQDTVGISLIDDQDEESETALHPWGLFHAPDKIHLLDECLPEASQQEIIIRGSQALYKPDQHPVNQHLIQTLFTELAPYSRQLRFLLSEKAAGEEIDERLIMQGIMDALPAPLAEQVRKLFASEPGDNQQIDVYARISTERLMQLERTGTNLIELLCLTLLSQLWDEQVARRNRQAVDQAAERPSPPQNQTFVVLDSLKEELLRYLRLTKAETRSYNFIPLVQGLRAQLEALDRAYFVEELVEIKSLYADNAAYREASDFFMLDLKKELYTPGHKVAADELLSFCVQAEKHLAELFSHLGFTARYKMLTIKNIDFKKERHKPASYRHFHIMLDTVTTGYHDKTAEVPVFVDSNSVMWIRDNKRFEGPLNLSPFIIDENGLKNEPKAKLFFFDHLTPNGPQYRYLNRQTEYLPASPYKEPLNLQFEQFCQDVLGMSIAQITSS